MPDFTYVCPLVEVETEEGRRAFAPSVHQYWKNWRAVDGRVDPSKPGGECLVEALGVPVEVHDQMIATGEITEITPGNVQSEFSTRYATTCRSIDDVKSFFRERRGNNNPLFKAAPRSAAKLSKQ